MVSVTLRPLVVAFVAIDTCTVPLPVPESGAGLTHGGLPVTVHPQPAWVVTVTLKLLASAGT